MFMPGTTSTTCGQRRAASASAHMRCWQSSVAGGDASQTSAVSPSGKILGGVMLGFAVSRARTSGSMPCQECTLLIIYRQFINKDLCEPMKNVAVSYTLLTIVLRKRHVPPSDQDRFVRTPRL